MLTKDVNTLLTQIGPGTPMGSLMRRSQRRVRSL